MGVCFNPVRADNWPNCNWRDMKIVIYNRLQQAGLVGQDKPIKYLVHGSEICPTTGTPHLQLFIVFKNDMTLQAIMKKFESWLGMPSCFNWKKADNNIAACIKYCTKDNTEVSEYGLRPKGKGARSDLDAVVDLVKSGATMSDIVSECPTQFILFSGGIQKLLMYSVKPRDFKTEIYWIWGPTGTGKSRWAYAQMDSTSSYFKSASNKWWDGYTGQKDVLLDDFRPNKELPFDMMLRLLDRYPLTVELKGATSHFTSQRIFITAPTPPRTSWSSCEWIGTEQLDQLERRVDHVINFSTLQGSLGYAAATPYIPEDWANKKRSIAALDQNSETAASPRVGTANTFQTSLSSQTSESTEDLC